MTLRLRFLLAFVLNTLLVLYLFSGSYYVVERRAITAAQREEERRTAEKTASVCQLIEMASSPIVAFDFIDGLKRDPAVAFAACVDARGRVQAHSDPDWLGRAWPDSPTPHGIKQSRAPVLIEGRQAGFAVVAYNADVRDTEVRGRLWGVLRVPLIVAALTFVFSLIVSLFLASSLSRPISKLAQAARAIGEGNLDFRSPVESRTDELGHLGKDINAMAIQLKRLDDLKAEFIAIVSHDIRSPLAAVISYADHLLSGGCGILTVEQSKAIKVIESECRQLTNLVSNILDMAKIQAGGMEYIRKPFELSDVVKPIAAVFEVAAAQARIGLRVDIAANVPRVVGDGDKIKQVVTNLLSNALKFTQAGGSVTIAARLAPDSGKVEVSVRDTGCGIAEHELSGLFERFHQINTIDQRTQNIVGTGLGLAISKKIVEAHGERIRVESKVGVGTAFVFTLAPAAGNGAASS